MRVGGRRRASRRERRVQSAAAASSARSSTQPTSDQQQAATPNSLGNRATSGHTSVSQPRSLAAIVQGVNDEKKKIGRQSSETLVIGRAWARWGCAQGGLVEVVAFGRDGRWAMGSARARDEIRSSVRFVGRPRQGMQGMQGQAGKRRGCRECKVWRVGDGEGDSGKRSGA